MPRLFSIDNGAMPKTATPTYPTADAAWTNALHTLASGVGVRRQHGYTARLEEPPKCYVWNPAALIDPTRLAGIFSWLLAFTKSDAHLKEYAPEYLWRAEEGGIDSAEGPRIRCQLQQVIETLRTEEARWPEELAQFRRGAVISTWQQPDLDALQENCKEGLVSCATDLISLHFFIEASRLCACITFTGLEAYGGLPEALFTYGSLLNILAGAVGLEPGFLQLSAGVLYLHPLVLEQAPCPVALALNGLGCAGYYEEMRPLPAGDLYLKDMQPEEVLAHIEDIAVEEELMRRDFGLDNLRGLKRFGPTLKGSTLGNLIALLMLHHTRKALPNNQEARLAVARAVGAYVDPRLAALTVP